jgi:hypothetical protein
VSPAESRSLAGGAVVRTALVARLLGLRLLTVEGSVLLMPLPFGMPEDHPTRSRTPSRHKANATTTGVRPLGRRPARSQLGAGIGASLGASARLIDESVEDLRALDHRPRTEGRSLQCQRLF